MKGVIKQYKNLIFLVVGVLLALTLIFNLHIIPTGYTGVRTTFGQIQPEPVQSGKQGDPPRVPLGHTTP